MTGTLFGIIAITLAAASNIVYIIDILRGRTKPHLYTYLIWGFLTFIIFFGQLLKGGGAGAWATGTTAVFSIVILLLSFRYGTKDVTRADTLILIGAVLAFLPWLITHDPLWSVILATLIECTAYPPTMRKTLRDPDSESVWSWRLSTAKHLFTILAMQEKTLITLFSPVLFFCTNVSMLVIIRYGKIIARRGKRRRHS